MRTGYLPLLDATDKGAAGMEGDYCHLPEESSAECPNHQDELAPVANVVFFQYGPSDHGEALVWK
jgi:hypothetical protein